MKRGDRRRFNPGRPKGPPTKPVLLKFERAFLDRIEDYWHRARLPSRTAAIRELLERGLK
jgi:hypothetical protein